MFSFIQNVEFFALMRSLEALFVLFESKMENNHIFSKKNCMVFSSIIQNDELKLKIFWNRRELNTPLVLSKKCRIYYPHVGLLGLFWAILAS